MFRCERCGSRYSAVHATALENCPRCQIRDRVSAPLTFKVFRLPLSAKRAEASGHEGEKAEIVPSRGLGPS